RAASGSTSSRGSPMDRAARPAATRSPWTPCPLGPPPVPSTARNSGSGRRAGPERGPWSPVGRWGRVASDDLEQALTNEPPDQDQRARDVEEGREVVRRERGFGRDRLHRRFERRRHAQQPVTQQDLEPVEAGTEL